MIVNRPNQKYEHLGVTYAIAAAVMATEASEYRGLYGTITEIRDGSDRETENDTPDIYCCFEPPLFQEEIRELERRFTDLYQSPKKLDEITLDMVIMAPEMVRVISPDPSVCKTCKVYLLTMQFTTSWDSGCITELYADYDNLLPFFEVIKCRLITGIHDCTEITPNSVAHLCACHCLAT